MNLSEKVAYIKGLAEGLGIDDSTKEGKVIGLMVEALRDMSLSIEDLEHDYDELRDNIEILDEDLTSLEDDFYEDDDCECGCGGHGHGHDHGCGCGCEDDDFYEVTCPTCDEVFYVDSEMLEEDDISCPSCSEAFEVSIDEDDDDEDMD